MINWKSLLSVFDDKPTIVQWLKKVEKALTDSAVESVQVNNVGGDNFALSLIFADGTSQTSPAFTIKQGNKFTELTTLDLSVGEPVVTYDTETGATIENHGQINGDPNSNFENKIEIPIKAGENFSIDASEDGKSLVLKVPESTFSKYFKKPTDTSPNARVVIVKDGTTQQDFLPIFASYYVAGSIVARDSEGDVKGNAPKSDDGYIPLKFFNANTPRYRHNIVFTNLTGYMGVIRATVYSHSNIACDSLTDLKTVLGNPFAEICAGFIQDVQSRYSTAAFFDSINGISIYDNAIGAITKLSWAQIGTISDTVTQV